MILVFITLQAVMMLQPASTSPHAEEQTSTPANASPSKLAADIPIAWNARVQGQSSQRNNAGERTKSLTEGTEDEFVRRRTTRHLLEGSEVEAAIRKSLAYYGSNISVKIVDLSKGSYPDGHLEFSLNGVVPPPLVRPTSPFLWRGHEVSDDGNWIPVWTRVEVTTLRQLVRVRGNFLAGHVLITNDLETFQTETCPLLVRQDDQLKNYEGMLLKRSLRSGSQLTPYLVKTLPAVERGSIVPVQASVGRADIRFEAEADLSGYPGQIIQLTNTSSKRHFRGIVQTDGSVLVRAYMVQRKSYTN